jgi:hypothetical protein
LWLNTYRQTSLLEQALTANTDQAVRCAWKSDNAEALALLLLFYQAPALPSLRTDLVSINAEPALIAHLDAVITSLKRAAPADPWFIRTVIGFFCPCNMGETLSDDEKQPLLGEPFDPLSEIQHRTPTPG